MRVSSTQLMPPSLSDLLMKDSNNIDPARVINISSIASVRPRGESLLGSEGYWACKSLILDLQYSVDSPSS